MDVEADPVVSHFKGLFKTFKMRCSTFLYSYWIGLQVHFKKAILHLKRAKGVFIFLATVAVFKLSGRIPNLEIQMLWALWDFCFKFISIHY